MRPAIKSLPAKLVPRQLTRGEMLFSLTRSQVVVFSALAIVVILLSFFPQFGAPHFRYTECDPSHYVWNLGVPFATCIYDSTTSPCFFIGPMAYVHGGVSFVGFAVIYVLLFGWNNRHFMILNAVRTKRKGCLTRRTS